MKNRPKERGLLLVTTLLIVAFLTALTVGFIVINRDNLMFARRIREGENALQAAYAGLHYVMMRLEEDRGFGVAPFTPGETQPNTSTRQYDAFPDGMPTQYGQSGIYWNGNGSGGGYTIPYNSSSFTVYETGATVVGLISSNDSHFQIHFRHFGGGTCPTFNGTATTYASNGFDDLSVASEDYRNWRHQRSAQETHSLNNLNNPVSVTSGRKRVPAYTARIIATGYSHGSTRVVEALLKRVFFTNSSALAASDITVRMSTSSISGDGTWYISSLAPSSNSIEAGAGYGGGRFRQAGGDINAYTGLSSSIPADKIIFSTTDTNTRNTGNGYALRAPGSTRTPPGTVRNIGGSSYPNASGQTFVNTGKNSGTFYAAADNTVPLPPRDLTGFDVLSQMGATPVRDSSGVSYISQNDNCFIEPGIWAFESNSGHGNAIQVYNFSGGSGSRYTTETIGPCLAVNNYQLMIRPGKHVTVGSAGTAQGDLMITLSPTFQNNFDPDPNSRKFVLPTLALGYQGANQLGNSGNPDLAAATLTLGGNLYVQGQVVGRGAIIAQSNTTTNGNWLPGNFGPTSWARTIYDGITEGHPPNLDSADIFMEGTSQLQKSPNYSVVLYSEGNTRFNPVASNFTDQLGVPTSLPSIPPDSQAFANALNRLACGSSGCSGEWWTQAIPQPTNNPIGASLNSFIEFGHDLTKLTPFLRTIKNRRGPQGANSAPTDKTAGNIWCPENPGCQITDPNAVAYLRGVPGSQCTGGSCDGSQGVLNLYQYTQLSNYRATQDNQWLLAYPRPDPDSENPLNPVEYSILSSVNQYAQQAYMGNHQNLGTYLGGGTTLDYQQQDLTFQGFIYSKGPHGFVSYPNNTRFAFQGAVVTTQGPMEIGSGPFDPGQANFLYDPSHLLDFYRLPYGHPITIQWMVVW